MEMWLSVMTQHSIYLHAVPEEKVLSSPRSAGPTEYIAGEICEMEVLIEVERKKREMKNKLGIEIWTFSHRTSGRVVRFRQNKKETKKAGDVVCKTVPKPHGTCTRIWKWICVLCLFVSI